MILYDILSFVKKSHDKRLKTPCTQINVKRGNHHRGACCEKSDLTGHVDYD
jgi:hypothetical protein